VAPLPDTIVICLARAPERGKVKSRLADEIGDEGALECYRELLAILARTLRNVPFAVEVSVDGDWDASDFQSLFGNKINRSRQPEGDLGNRMHSIVNDALHTGRKKVILIGSDCPGLTPEILRYADIALDERDLVLGPARDGGYYLIGMKQLLPELFENVPWSTDAVLPITLAQARRHSRSYHLLEELSDVDTLADWHIWRKSLS